ncbi:MAG: class I SAM-dependent methyltransferase [Candidatus Latescibacteria bacterium]|nr:class I SAM-dependent methyltransferase [Candidatus Latescibacterota bacterium]
MSDDRVEVPCNLCGSNYTNLLYVVGDARVVQCRVCDLVYLNPRAEEGVAARNRTRDLVAHFAPLAPRQRVVFERRLGQVRKVLGRSGRLLDVGCAAGGFMAVAREQGWSVAGVDVNGPATAHAREALGLDVVTGTLADLPEAYGGFDVVTLWDVVEHVPDPKGLIAQVRERVVEGGLIALSVPNVASLAAWVGKERWPMFGDEHLTYFTPETIRKMVKFTGFEVRRIETEGLGRHFLSSWRSSRVADKIESSYVGSNHRPVVLFAERIVNALLNLIQAGQVISVYATKRSGPNDAPLPHPPAASRVRRGRRGRTFRGVGL